MRGALASCYISDCKDGTVHGLSIAVLPPGREQSLHFSQLSLRPGLPLQSTLYGLAEMAARELSANGIDPQAVANAQLNLTVLWDPATHGTVKEPDFDGFDSAERALLTLESGRWAWSYDPRKSPNELLTEASREAQVRSPGTTTVLSLAALSTESPVLVTAVPRPQTGPKIRPPGVAGSFYPEDKEELSKMVDGLLADTGDGKESWPAVMVPHAGLVYSGKIASDVYKQIKIPEVVIIIGPRHRPMGMEWAVAPHETWSLPGLSVPSDPELARQLAEAIPDLHLDALAHQQEHCIEIQLPLLARLAPHSRVVGIVMGGADLERCREFATGLAKVLRRQRPKPLLVISSDMNHYANDAENRRLDEIALSALERLDPADLYETTTKQKISMCGMLPAVVVIETLRQLKTLKKCRRISYSTSADASGDESRVVGYAGMLFR